jgi:hypothetical protein
MDMANGNSATSWRNFAAWSAVGAFFYVLVVWIVSSLLSDDGTGAIFRSGEVVAMLGVGLLFSTVVVGATSWKRPINMRSIGSFMIWNVVAIVACLLVVWSLDAGGFGEVGGSEAAALAVGAVFLFIGVMMAVGLASPAFGARYLNVEDAGDLREQRPVLWPSAGAMAAWGLMLVLLAVGGPAGSLSPSAALAGAGALLAISVVLTLVAWRVMDELMRGLSTEAGNMSYYLVALVGGGWAMLAHLGFVTAPAPLDWLTILTGLALPASFIVAGRRGLLAQRSK